MRATKENPFRAGQKAWSIHLGDCIIREVDNHDNSRAVLAGTASGESQYYFLDGSYMGADAIPSLYHSNPFEQQQPFKERVMEVSHNGVSWYKRVVLCESRGRYIAWENAEKLEDVNTDLNCMSWKLACEIQDEQPKELTMEEISEKFNIPLNLLRIKK
jgi:hypothetical protein